MKNGQDPEWLAKLQRLIEDFNIHYASCTAKRLKFLNEASKGVCHTAVTIYRNISILGVSDVGYMLATVGQLHLLNLKSQCSYL